MYMYVYDKTQFSYTRNLFLCDPWVQWDNMLQAYMYKH